MFVRDVGVAKLRQRRQLGVAGRVVGETHDASRSTAAAATAANLDVGVSDGQRGVVLGGALQVALLLHLPPHGGVPVVLDGVVGPGKGEQQARGSLREKPTKDGEISRSSWPAHDNSVSRVSICRRHKAGVICACVCACDASAYTRLIRLSGPSNGNHASTTLSCSCVVSFDSRIFSSRLGLSVNLRPG